MLGFVQNLLAPRSNPIGIDFGTDCLRLAQVQYVDGDHRLIAAASAQIPSQFRNDPGARLNFFAQNIRPLLSTGGFRGRQAVLSLPASVMHIRHARISRMDEAALARELPTIARDMLPLDPSQTLLRHLVVGEICQGDDPKLEVIIMAAAKPWIGQYLQVASSARLSIAGMNVEPLSIVDCFRHVYRRKLDAEVTHCFIDIGASATRAVIARHGQLLFARSIPIGGDHFTLEVAKALDVSFEDARVLRIKLAAAAPIESGVAEKQSIAPPLQAAAVVAAPAPAPAPMAAALAYFEQGDTALARADFDMRRESDTTTLLEPLRLAEPLVDPTEQHRRADAACLDTADALSRELDSCRRYYEEMFPEKPVERLIFIGAEARQRHLCQHVAQRLNIAAQIGDPLCRMGRISKIGIESGIDRRLPQPDWVVAIGLSMGPRAEEEGTHAFASDC